MDWKGIMLKALVAIVAELVRRLGHNDLAEQCEECLRVADTDAAGSQKEG